MSKLISIRDDLYEKLNELRTDEGHKHSFSGAIDKLFIKTHVLQEEASKLQETTVTQEGRISKTLAGKTILYKVKEETK